MCVFPFCRSSASPISQLPPFLLAAMTAGANGPRLDALLRQMSQGGPPSKKPKVGNNLRVFPRDYSSSFSKVLQMCAKSNPLRDKSAVVMSRLKISLKKEKELFILSKMCRLRIFFSLSLESRIFWVVVTKGLFSSVLS